MHNPTPFVSSEVEKREPGARERFSTSLETTGGVWSERTDDVWRIA
ncbi:hypothetical protein ACX0GZ_02280 [Sphingomonas aestuarii]|jgi:hypothetical protein